MIPIPKQSADCKVSLENLKAHLATLIGGLHGEMISHMIIAHLAKTEMGITHLVLALAGIEPVFKYKVGTEVLISIDKLHSWKIDRELTLKHSKTGPAFGYARGTITEVSPLSRYPYKCSVIAVVSGGHVKEEDMVFMEEDIIPDETIDDLIK